MEKGSEKEPESRATWPGSLVPIGRPERESSSNWTTRGRSSFSFANSTTRILFLFVLTTSNTSTVLSKDPYLCSSFVSSYRKFTALRVSPLMERTWPTTIFPFIRYSLSLGRRSQCLNKVTPAAPKRPFLPWSWPSSSFLILRSSFSSTG
jgi:hypothetical protein